MMILRMLLTQLKKQRKRMKKVENSLFHKIKTEISLDHSEKQNSHQKTLKQRAEPLIISDTIDDDEDTTKRSNLNAEKENKEQLIEKFNSGQTQNKIFVPKKGSSNNTAPDLNFNKILTKPNDSTLN